MSRDYDRPILDFHTLHKYAQCPYEALLRLLGTRQRRFHEDRVRQSVGEAVHQSLGGNAPARREKLAAERVAAAPVEVRSETADRVQELIPTAEYIRRAFPNRLVAEQTIVWLDKELGYEFRTTPDLTHEDDDAITLIEVKTGSDRVLLEAQLRHHGLLCRLSREERDLPPKSIRLVGYLLGGADPHAELKPAVDFWFGRRLMERDLQKLRDLALRILEGLDRKSAAAFPPNPGPGCKHCVYAWTCSVGQAYLASLSERSDSEPSSAPLDPKSRVA